MVEQEDQSVYSELFLLDTFVVTAFHSLSCEMGILDRVI